MKLNDIKIGQKVNVRTWSGRIETGKIVGKDEDIKNGMPGIDYETDDGEGYWCYLSQIVKVY